MIARFERLVFGQYPQRGPGGGPGSGRHHPSYSMSRQKERDDARRAERQRNEREAYRKAGLVHRSEPNYQQKVKSQFTDYAKRAHGLNQQQADKHYQEIAQESYLSGQRNVGGRGGGAPGGGSSYNINTVSRTNAAVKPVTVRSRSGGFPLLGGAVMAGAQQLTGLGGGMPYVANSIFDSLDRKVGQSSHLNPTYDYYQASVAGPESVMARNRRRRPASYESARTSALGGGSVESPRTSALTRKA